MTTDSRFALLVKTYLDSDSLAVELDSLDCMDCVTGMPAGLIPEQPSMGNLVRNFVYAFASEDFSELPKEMEQYMVGWLCRMVISQD